MIKTKWDLWVGLGIGFTIIAILAESPWFAVAACVAFFFGVMDTFSKPEG